MNHRSALFLASLFAVPSLTAAQPNIVANGDFEVLALDEFELPIVDDYGNNAPVSWFRRNSTPAESPTQPVELIQTDDSDGVGTNSFALNYYEVSVGPVSFPATADMRSIAFEAIAGETLTWSFDYKFIGADQSGGDEFRADLRFFEDVNADNPQSTGSMFIFEDQYYSGSDGVDPDSTWVSLPPREFVVPFDSPDSPDDDGRPAAGTTVFGDVRISVNAFTAFNAGQVLFDNIRVTRPISADFNADGVVDAADYTIWRDTNGSMSDLRADATNDGVVDQSDYGRWAAEYGFAVSPLSQAVPEPACAALIGLLAFVVGAPRRS
ncbi:hypothetical protein [Botrimarina sp.]|uniref:hypothetical protein n=1 Tax=Botrimarina sp. TaxID=2795802 RepID=UPI0032ED9CCC